MHVKQKKTYKIARKTAHTHRTCLDLLFLIVLCLILELFG